jgi:hypothetical protein
VHRVEATKMHKRGEQRMSEMRKVPPSKIKYLQKNPVVSFHLPIELRDRLRGIAAKDGVTVATYVKRLLSDLTAREDDRGKAWQEGYDAGFRTARERYEIRYRCPVCGESITILPGSPHHVSIVRNTQKEGWRHKKCMAVNSKYR